MGYTNRARKKGKIFGQHRDGFWLNTKRYSKITNKNIGQRKIYIENNEYGMIYTKL